MRTSRLLLLTVIVVALVGLTSWWGGRPASGDSTATNDPIPSVGTEDTLSSTWYCAAGSAGIDPPPAHVLFLSNPSARAISVRLTAYGADGQVGSNLVDAAPAGVTTVDVNTLFNATGLSVMAESETGTLGVEHRLGTTSMVDSTACATTSSGAWFFPSQTTLRDTSAQITLFNPFSADAGVDITAAVTDGMRSPSQWAGIVVPAGTSRVIDLGQYIQTRDLFSVAVKMRTGRVVAETSQVLNIPADEKTGTLEQRGLRLQVGVPEARRDWTFATGFTGPGVSERLVVYNPNRRSSSVVVQVTPYGAAEMPPEPFQLEVPGNRFAVIDLGAESRIPAEGFHSIEIESDEDAPVVVSRVLQLMGPPTAPSNPAIGVRPSETLGTSVGTGTPVDAERWLLPAVLMGPGQEPMAFVHNPGTGIVTVRVEALMNAAPVEVASGVEVAPGDSAWIALNPAQVAALQEPGNVSFQVVASAPVSVERTITYSAANDVTVGLALPVIP